MRFAGARTHTRHFPDGNSAGQFCKLELMEHTRLYYTLLFGAGVVAQGALTVRDQADFKGIGSGLGMALLMMMPGKHERHYSLYFHLFLAICAFAFTVAMYYRKAILPCLSELLLLSYTITFWFALSPYFTPTEGILRWFIYPLILPTVGALIITFVKVKLDFAGKLMFYTWFLLMTVIIACIQLPGVYIRIFLGDGPLPMLDSWLIFFTGMAFFFLAVNMTYLYELIPLRGEKETKEQRMQRWHELTDLMTQRYDPDPAPFWQGMLLILAQIGFIVMNIRTQAIPDMLLVSLLIVVMPAVHGSGSASDAIAARQSGGG